MCPTRLFLEAQLANEDLDGPGVGLQQGEYPNFNLAARGSSDPNVYLRRTENRFRFNLPDMRLDTEVEVPAEYMINAPTGIPLNVSFVSTDTEKTMSTVDETLTSFRKRGESPMWAPEYQRREVAPAPQLAPSEWTPTPDAQPASSQWPSTHGWGDPSPKGGLKGKGKSTW